MDGRFIVSDGQREVFFSFFNLSKELQAHGGNFRVASLQHAAIGQIQSS
jgi:hypothetical protein